MKSKLLENVSITGSSEAQLIPFKQYSLHAAEHAAFEHMMHWVLEAERILATKPANTMTPQILGAGCWLIEGRLATSHDAGSDDNPLSAEAADNPLFPEEFEGIGQGELLDFADALRNWCQSPEFIELPEGHYMGAGPVPPREQIDARRGIDMRARPYRQHSIHGWSDVCVQGDTIVSIDGDDAIAIELDTVAHALLAGGGCVMRIVMYVPDLEKMGRPTCFDLLDNASLLTHLTYGTGYTSFYTAEHMCAKAEVRPTISTEFTMEYHFSVSPEVVATLKRLG